MVRLGENEGCTCLLCMGKRGDTSSRVIKFNRNIRNEANVTSFNVCSVCFEEMKKEINELDYFKN